MTDMEENYLYSIEKTQEDLLNIMIINDRN